MAISQEEADIVAGLVSSGKFAHIQVHWVPGFNGVQPLLQPVRVALNNRLDN